MRYIVIISILLHVSLFGLEFTFDDLRKEERIVVLQEFKKLYYKRKNVHQNIRQVLNHARSNSLNKNKISFFQAKTKYKKIQAKELNNAYVPTDISCEVECQNASVDVGYNSSSVLNHTSSKSSQKKSTPSFQAKTKYKKKQPSGLSYDGDTTSIVDSDINFAVEDTGVFKIRGSAASPWAKR